MRNPTPQSTRPPRISDSEAPTPDRNPLDTELVGALGQLAEQRRQLLQARAAIEHLERELSKLRDALHDSLAQNRVYLQELSMERRNSLRVMQQQEQYRVNLEAELRKLRERVSGESEPPRHSLIVERNAAYDRRTAETVRPPPVAGRR